ncbi:unnamed protein product [Pedinophyceae sp. YPF-701]|nr:unnamed protein product [Pedinophyceae sp. YPF-701]
MIWDARVHIDEDYDALPLGKKLDGVSLAAVRAERFSTVGGNLIDDPDATIRHDAAPPPAVELRDNRVVAGLKALLLSSDRSSKVLSARAPPLPAQDSTRALQAPTPDAKACEDLLEAVRRLLPRVVDDEVTEQFGWPVAGEYCFRLHGNVLGSVTRAGHLRLRTGKELTPHMVASLHVQRCKVAVTSWASDVGVLLDHSQIDSNRKLRAWLAVAAEYVSSLPTQKPPVLSALRMRRLGVGRLRTHGNVNVYSWSRKRATQAAACAFGGLSALRMRSQRWSARPGTDAGDGAGGGAVAPRRNRRRSVECW